jgi:release factor glutamine methyltransferase
MRVKDLLAKFVLELRAQGFEQPQSEAELLVSGVLGWRRHDLIARDQEALSPTQITLCEQALVRRKNGEPLAYILGCKDFYKHSFFVGPGVLIPRPETEMIVEAALECFAEKNAHIQLADLGAGTGCIGLSILAERSDAKLVAIEKSPEARVYLEKNTHHLFSLKSRVQIFAGSVEDALGVHPNWASYFDLIVANPPYIATDDPDVMPEVRRYEPAIALFAEDNGRALIREWSKLAAKCLKPGGWFLLEIGSGQADIIESEPWLQWGYEVVKLRRDLSEHPRLVLARRCST